MGNSNNEANQQVNRMQAATNNGDRNRWRKMGGKNRNFAALIALIFICGIWTVAAHAVAKPFIFPYFEDVIKEVVYSLSDMYVLRNLGITMRRVLTGAFYAFIIGLPLGMIMGYSPKILRALSPFMNSLRQVPIMAWVPLAIVWFGIGDGPTIFLIAFSGVFTIILNTSFRSTGYQQGLLQCSSFDGCKYTEYHKRHRPSGISSRCYDWCETCNRTWLDVCYMSGVHCDQCRFRLLYGGSSGEDAD